MRKLLIIVLLALLALVGYFIASPYLALNNIKNAAQNKDIDTISAYVDFPSVRSGIKEQLKSELSKDIDLTQKDTNDFETLGAMMAIGMIDGLVDTMITPNNLGVLLEGKDFAKQLSQADDTLANDDDNQPASNALDKDWQIDTAYQSTNQFVVNITNPDNGKQAQAVLQRDGLFGWKVVKLNLPLDNLK